jgi:hypothetical protein
MSWHALEPVDASFFDTAPLIYRYPTPMAAPLADVWESLVSDRSVSAWGPSVERVRWTSERPFGVGTTREVTLVLRSVTVREQFFRWDEGKGYSFFASESNRPGVRRFAENYVLEPDGDGTLLTWTVAIEPSARAAGLMRLSSPATRFAFGRLASDGQRYFAKK